MKKFNSIYSQLTGKKFQSKSPSDVYYEEKYFEKVLQCEVLNAFFSFCSILSSIAYYEFTDDLNDSGGNFIVYLYFTSVFSILLFINLIFQELINLNLDLERNRSSFKENIFSSGKWKEILFKILIFFPHPNVFLCNINLTSYYLDVPVVRKLNSILTMFVMMRTYFIFRFVLYCTSYMKPQMSRICGLHFTDTNLLFSIRALIKNYPFIFYPLSTLFIIIVFDMLLKIVESDLQEVFKNFFQCLWYILVSMLTIGYGDLVVKTNEGRIIGMLLSFFGIFVSSMMIISINKKLEMTPSEVNSFVIINKIFYNEKVENAAKKVIYFISKIVNNRKSNPKVYKKSFILLKKVLTDFSEAYIEMKNFSGENTSFNMIYNLLFGEISNHEILYGQQMDIYKKLFKINRDLSRIYKQYKLENDKLNNSILSFE